MRVRCTSLFFCLCFGLSCGLRRVIAGVFGGLVLCLLPWSAAAIGQCSAPDVSDTLSYSIPFRRRSRVCTLLDRWLCTVGLRGGSTLGPGGHRPPKCWPAPPIFFLEPRLVGLANKTAVTVSALHNVPQNLYQIYVSK